MDEERAVLGAGDDEAQLGRDDDAGDGVLVASQDSSGGRNLRGELLDTDWRRAVVFGSGGKINELLLVLTSVIGTDTT